MRKYAGGLERGCLNMREWVGNMRAANQLAAGMGVWEDPKGGLKDPRGVLKDSLGIRGETYGSRESIGAF